MRIKKEFLGHRTNLKNLGMVKLRPDHLNILIREGRTEFLEGNDKEVDSEPLEVTNCDLTFDHYDKLKKAELVEMAQGLEIDTKGMNKSELIEAILDVTFTEGHGE